MPDDLDNLALHIYAKKRKLKRADFKDAMPKAHITEKPLKTSGSA